MACLLRPGLYAITDCEHLPFQQVLEKTAAILDAGIAALQYRNKTGDPASRREQATQLASLCRSHATPLIINDDPELARECAADGVHLGQDDTGCADARRLLGAGVIIGVSCYDSLERALDARSQGADYVAFGAFYPTATKTAGAHPRPELLARARAKLHVPIVAIGGITADNAPPLLAAGADNVAVVSALYGAADPAAAVRKFHEAFRTHARAHGDQNEQSTV